MTRILLMRGMLAGVFAGLLVFALGRWIGEPEVQRAIAFETAMDQAKGDTPEPAVVSRKMQSTLGLLTATLVDGIAVGGIFALVFALARGRLPVANPRALSVLLAGLGFVTIAVVPALKYPANPPAAGNPETIGVRSAAFFLLIAFSLAFMVLAVQIEQRFHRRWGGWNATLAAALFFIVAMTAVSHFFPTFDEVPAGFPVTLMWNFRVASLEMQVLLWSTLGFVFGLLAERSLVGRRLRA